MTRVPFGLSTAVVLVLTASVPHIAQAYDFNAVLWDRASSPLPLELHNAPVSELTIEELEAIVEATVTAWNQVPCAWLKLRYAGLTDDTIEPVTMRDNRQILEFVSDEERWVYGSMTAGAMLADVYDPPETPERELPRVDIAFNGIDFDWRIGGAGIRDVSVLDPESVLTHEVGHLLGLGHTPISNAATMARAYLPDLGQRSLAFDDMAGLCAKYWTPGDGCTNDTDCPEGHTCQTFTEPDSGQQARLCSEPHGTWGDPCSSNDLRCEGYCLFTISDLSDGFCSDLCNPEAEQSPCPEGWSCQNIQTASNPLFFCRESDEPEPEPDAGMDTTDTTAEPDTNPATEPAIDGGLPMDTTTTPMSDLDDGSGPSSAAGGGGDGGCQSVHLRPLFREGALGWGIVVGLMVFMMGQRRR
ncbi:MAG: matrixin family metalloprotease [Myxococcota bacterium]